MSATPHGSLTERCKCGHTRRSHKMNDNGWGGGRFCKVALCRCLNYDPPQRTEQA